MLQFDEYKVKLNNLLPQLEELEQALDLDEAERELDMLRGRVRRRRLLGQPWRRPRRSSSSIKQLQNKVESARPSASA